MPIAPNPADVAKIAPSSVLNVTQDALDYAAGCIAWGGARFSVIGLAQRLDDYARKTRDSRQSSPTRSSEAM